MSASKELLLEDINNLQAKLLLVVKQRNEQVELRLRNELKILLEQLESINSKSVLTDSVIASRSSVLKG